MTGFRAAREAATPLCEALARLFHLNGLKLSARARIGIALTCGRVDATRVLREADVARYRAKALGGARIEVFSPGGDAPEVPSPRV